MRDSSATSDCVRNLSIGGLAWLGWLLDACRADEVRLLGEDKEMLGIFGLDDAIQQAEDLDLDVVLISPDADPPVCRMMDASRHKYELDKRDKEVKKKQREARCTYTFTNMCST